MAKRTSHFTTLYIYRLRFSKRLPQLIEELIFNLYFFSWDAGCLRDLILCAFCCDIVLYDGLEWRLNSLVHSARYVRPVRFKLKMNNFSSHFLQKWWPWSESLFWDQGTVILWQQMPIIWTHGWSFIWFQSRSFLLNVFQYCYAKSCFESSDLLVSTTALVS